MKQIDFVLGYINRHSPYFEISKVHYNFSYPAYSSTEYRNNEKMIVGGRHVDYYKYDEIWCLGIDDGKQIHISKSPQSEHPWEKFITIAIRKF